MLNRSKLFSIIICATSIILVNMVAAWANEIEYTTDYSGDNIIIENPEEGFEPICIEEQVVEDETMDGEEVLEQQESDTYYADSSNIYDQDPANFIWRSKLSSTEKVGYDIIYAGIKKGQKDIDVKGKGVTRDNLKGIIYSIAYDHPELFWMEQSYGIIRYPDGRVITVQANYNSLLGNRNYAQSKIDASLKNAFAAMNCLDSDIKKVKYAHDYIAHSVDYNSNANYNQTIYSSIVLKQSVCVGYSRAFQYMVQKYGIPCAYVEGTVNVGGHSWNLVKLDGEYYNIDVTWDDPITYDWNGVRVYGDKYIRFKYFNVTDSVLNKDHTRSSMSSRLPAARGTKYSYTKYYNGNAGVTNFAAVVVKDTTKPTGSIAATNNIAKTQTVTLKLSDNAAVAGYYWGTDSNYKNNKYTSAKAGNVTKTVSNTGTYYLTVKDASGNISATVNATFCKISFDNNGGTLNPSYIIARSGKTVTLPKPKKYTFKFCGWSTTDNATSGNVKSVKVTKNLKYYATWIYYMPEVPKLVATYNGANGIGIQWEKADKATHYQIWRKYNGKWTKIATVSQTDKALKKDGNKLMYTDTSVKKNYGKGYIYSVASENEAGASKYDTLGLAAYRLVNPDISKVNTSGSGKVTVRWSNVTCQGYEVQFATKADAKANKWTKANEVKYGKNTITVSNLGKGKGYVFRIRCQKTNASRGVTWSQYSSWKEITVK